MKTDNEIDIQEKRKAGTSTGKKQVTELHVFKNTIM